MKRFSALLGPGAILATASAIAKEPKAVTTNLRTFWSGDYLQLCTGMNPKGPEVIACFKKNMSEESPGCRAAIADYKSQASKRPAPKPWRDRGSIPARWGHKWDHALPASSELAPDEAIPERYITLPYMALEGVPTGDRRGMEYFDSTDHDPTDPTTS